MDRSDARLALIECLDRDGRATRVLPVSAWPVSLGRAIDNDLVLDDPHVAAWHARLQATADGSLQLEVLDTLNGVGLDGRRLARGEVVALPAGGATLQLGGQRLRLRLRGETLAAERALPGPSGSARRLQAVLLALLMALALLEHGINLDPGADAAAWLPVLAGLPLALGGWCGLWALLSKLFQHRFDFGGHLRIALPWLLAIQLTELLAPQLAASLGWPALWRLAAPAQALLGGLWLHAHLQHLLPGHRRAVATAVLVVGLVGAGITLTHLHRSTDRLSRPAYMSTLPLPALDATRRVPPDAVVQALVPLAQAQAERVQQAARDEADGDAED